MVAGVLRQGMVAGDFCEGDVTLAAFTVVGMCNWASPWHRPQGGMGPRQIAYQLWNLIVNGWARLQRRQRPALSSKAMMTCHAYPSFTDLSPNNLVIPPGFERRLGADGQ